MVSFLSQKHGDSHDWNTNTEGYELFRKDRQGRRRWGGRLSSVKRWIACMELPLRNSQGQAESL